MMVVSSYEALVSSTFSRGDSLITMIEPCRLSSGSRLIVLKVQCTGCIVCFHHGDGGHLEILRAN